MNIDVDQCKENDLIKRIISKSELPVKLIKLLLRLSDEIYINGVNYNVLIQDKGATLLLISSKPGNKTGYFHTMSISNIFYRLRNMEKENHDLKTKVRVHQNMIQIMVEIA